MSSIVAALSRRLLRIGAVLSLCCASSGCLTCETWQRLDDTPGERAAAVALTPVTVAVDVTLFAAYVYVEAGCPGLCRCRCR